MRFWWRRQKAAHVEYITYLRWYENPNENNLRVWKRAMNHYNAIVAGRS